MIAALANAPTTTPAIRSMRESPRAPAACAIAECGDHGDDCAGERGDGQERAAESERAGDDRTNRRSARHSQQIRLGERIPHCALQRRAGHAESRADEHGEAHAGQAKLPNDHRRHGIAPAPRARSRRLTTEW